MIKDISKIMMWHVWMVTYPCRNVTIVCGHLTTYLDLESLQIQRSGFDFKSNLTSVIGDLANCNIQQDMLPATMPWPMTGPKIVLIKGIHNTVADQSHCFGMTPVSIEQLRATLRQKSTRTQKAIRDKTGRQSQILWCKLKVVTSNYEDCNLVFINHGKEDGIYPLRMNNTL